MNSRRALQVFLHILANATVPSLQWVLYLLHRQYQILLARIRATSTSPTLHAKIRVTLTRDLYHGSNLDIIPISLLALLIPRADTANLVTDPVCHAEGVVQRPRLLARLAGVCAIALGIAGRGVAGGSQKA